MGQDRWTLEEYRRYLETGQEPRRRPDSVGARPGMRTIPEAEIPPDGREHPDRVRRSYEERDADTAERKREISRTVQDAERQRRVEEAWAKAEREGRVVTIDVREISPVYNGHAGSAAGNDPEENTQAGSGEPCQAAGKKRKYRNEPVIVDGVRFDSRHEARVYRELMLRVKAGEIKCVCRQVGFDLPGGIRYFADFVVIFPDNRVEVIDAKSAITRKNRVYINKKKQMKACWGIEIVEA